MYETVNQISYAKLSYHPIQQPLPPSIPNPPPHFQSSSFDYSLAHHPPLPPSDPYPNYGPYPPNYSSVEAPPPYYSDPNAISPSWVVKQAAPVRYPSPIQPLRGEATASTSQNGLLNSNWVAQTSAPKSFKRELKQPKKVLKKTNASQSVWCTLCKLECNSIQIYEKHLSGKKHNQNIKKRYTGSSAGQASQLSNNTCGSSGTGTLGGQGMLGVPSVPTDLNAKKQKLMEGGTAAQSVRVCTICNIACNGEIAFADHLVGKKHGTQERALRMRTNLEPITASNPGIKSQENIIKKTKKVEPAWCEVCKISCTSVDGLGVHRQGRKHQKNLEKLRNSISSTTPAASTSAPLPLTNPLAEVVKNEESAPESEQVKKKGAHQKDLKDLETKKQRVLECGAAVDAVRTCHACNVVCNSETVFISHLAGQKHASMVKQAKTGPAASNQLVTAAI